MRRFHSPITHRALTGIGLASINGPSRPLQPRARSAARQHGERLREKRPAGRPRIRIRGSVEQSDMQPATNLIMLMGIALKASSDTPQTCGCSPAAHTDQVTNMIPALERFYCRHGLVARSNNFQEMLVDRLV